MVINAWGESVSDELIMNDGGSGGHLCVVSDYFSGIYFCKALHNNDDMPTHFRHKVW